MKPRRAFRRAGRQAAAIGLLLAASAAACAAQGAPVLYDGGGGWVALSGLSESIRPPGADWSFEDGIWIGRMPVDQDKLVWGRRVLSVEGALPPPPAAVELPSVRNPFGLCMVRSLSVRYDSVVRSRRWSLVFNREGEVLDFLPLVLPGSRRARLCLQLEDVLSGQRWDLRPSRKGREGDKEPKEGADAYFYAGALDDQDVEWSLVVMPGEGGRLILQGRVMARKSPVRRLRLRILVRTGAPGAPVLQEESPPAVVAVTPHSAIALFVDLAEPRRFRAVTDVPDAAGLEFDLAVTKSTGNFPRSATFSLEVDAWDPDGSGTVEPEVLRRLSHAGGTIALPEAVLRGEANALALFEPGRMELSHPGGFRDRAEVLQYLMLKTSGLFPDHDWASSAFMCAAQDAEGDAQIALAGDRASVAVNADPDLQAMLEMGQNRGQTVLEGIHKSRAPAVGLKTLGTSPGLDYNLRALYLCDYPALWEEGSPAAGVDLRHAEAELIAALACVLKKEGRCLLVGDSGPLAPFTTYHADALMCASSNPAEMRRQRALAGSRPVLWMAEGAGTEAEELARNLGFVRPGIINEN